MSEKFPKAGSLSIVLLIGLGFFAAGNSNGIMGEVADRYLPENLDEQQTISILEQVEDRFPTYVAKAESASGDLERLAEFGYCPTDMQNVLGQAEKALAYYREHDEFDGMLTGNALRALVDTGVEQKQELIEEASTVLRPADNYGGRMAFLWIAPLAFLVALVFLIVFLNDKRKGGYQAVSLTEETTPETT